MTYETIETLQDQLEEAREIIRDFEIDEKIVLRMIMDVQDMIFHCRDYAEISQAIATIINLHHPEVVAQAEMMDAEL